MLKQSERFSNGIRLDNPWQSQNASCIIFYVKNGVVPLRGKEHKEMLL